MTLQKGFIMNGFYWLSLIGFISILVAAGFWKNYFIDDENLFTPCVMEKKRPHPFLCGEKIPIKKASIQEMVLVEGISLNKAEQIRAFFNQYPQAALDDLKSLPGIGHKTIHKLKDYFF